MISTKIDMRQLSRDLQKAAGVFGETNETCIARWGVAACRQLIRSTQVKGEGAEPRKKQMATILKDANRVVFAVSKPSVVKMLQIGKMRGLVIDGVLVKFRPQQLLYTAGEVEKWVEANRDKKTGKTVRMRRELKAVATNTNLLKACRSRYKRIGKAKGGWIGAGQQIARFQRTGSRINIGKNISSYAHKWKGGGNAGMRKSTWNPVGTLTNLFGHVAQERVLRKKEIERAAIDGGRNTIKWYEHATEAKLKKI